MIRKITVLAFLLISSISFSQIGPVGHLTIFSEDGDFFCLFLDGVIGGDGSGFFKELIKKFDFNPFWHLIINGTNRWCNFI